MKKFKENLEGVWVVPVFFILMILSTLLIDSCGVSSVDPAASPPRSRIRLMRGLPAATVTPRGR